MLAEMQRSVGCEMRDQRAGHACSWSGKYLARQTLLSVKERLRLLWPLHLVESSSQGCTRPTPEF